MSNWYDPITERWYKMPTKKEPEKVIEVEDIYSQAKRTAKEQDIQNIWDALQDVCNI